ncbi:MAG: GTP pyrophosphokinase, (p)ppGpp synthetase I [uncultured Solirubrobacteraceae bacterium]|uniref:GTP pyrophosphokinase, (P)ppGpp synthetase I n=1 Tax=uncultured Solirubrobacteraceae bacterium TaxID=1162706 RepID=A0A6J4TXL0_9ACTN|nr:MAG: GTP pyrophosphokinase, (p)ppGpp synthetase I [uncultured Solirubrobacteraceae bacterium]
MTAPPPPVISDLELTCRAYAYGLELHEGQLRDSDAAPFILHPLEVAVLLRNRGYDDDVVAAGILHDAVEDTDATPAEIEERFGPRVARLVSVLSDDPGIEGYVERKGALRDAVSAAGEDARAIYAADKVTKARELRATLAREPHRAHDEAIVRRLDHYEASAAMLEARDPDSPLVRQLGFELWALRHLPPERPSAT